MQKYLYLLPLALCVLDRCDALVRGARTRHLDDVDVRTLLCRMVMVDTMFEDRDEEELPHCISISEEGKESDDLIPLPLQTNRLTLSPVDLHKLDEGILFVQVTNAFVEKGTIAVKPNSKFQVLEKLPGHMRHLEAVRNDSSLGQKTVAVVRILATDKEPTVTREQMQNIFKTNGISIATQFKACSNNQLNLSLSEFGVRDVRVSGPIESYGTRGATIINEAVEILKEQLQIDALSSIADRVMFCTPKGPGTWAASAGMHHWRLNFHDEWCASLTAGMHEFGHTIGLIHANEKGEKYGDSTGNMARSFRSSTSPQRCFDGRSMHVLQWMAESQKELSYDAVSSPSPRLVDLAAFVDISKAAPEDVVLISLNERLHIQYNRAKGINAGSGEKRDLVTINEFTEETGNNLVAGIRPGQKYTFPTFNGSAQTLVVEACHFYPGSDSTADKVIVSVGMGTSICHQAPLPPTPAPIVPISLVVEASEKETNFPTASDLSTPGASPVARPLTSPPTSAPTLSPTMSPTPFPTQSPVSPPTSQPATPTSPPVEDTTERYSYIWYAYEWLSSFSGNN